MNWYKTTITAAGFGNYLKGLGVSDDVISYLETASLDDRSRQFLINEARKNPQITVQQLQHIPLQQPKDPYTQVEYSLANYITTYEPYTKWVLVELKRHRLNPMRGAEPADSIYSPLTWTKYYNLGCFSLSRQGGHPLSAAFTIELREIMDWAQQNQIQLDSYTFETAIVASDQWHNEMAEEGEGTSYQENNIVFGPKWSGKDFEGFTIQEMTTKNDLDCEGNKMNHCVGSYADQVAKGRSRIFSLRDPNNEPHVTIETDISGKHVIQIRGKSNSEPKDLYKQMIAEWVQSGNGPVTSEDSFIDGEDDNLISLINGSRGSDLSSDIAQFGTGKDEYGLGHNTELPYAKDAYEALMDNLMGRRGDNTAYYSHMRHIAREFVKLYVMNPKIQEEQDMQQFLEKKQNELDDHLRDYSHTMVDMAYPHEDEFDSSQEYEKAREKYDEKEIEAMEYYWEHELPYAFIRDCLKAFDEAYQAKRDKMAKEEVHPKTAPTR